MNQEFKFKLEQEVETKVAAKMVEARRAAPRRAHYSGMLIIQRAHIEIVGGSFNRYRCRAYGESLLGSVTSAPIVDFEEFELCAMPIVEDENGDNDKNS